jgi:hypothetical protein
VSVKQFLFLSSDFHFPLSTTSAPQLRKQTQRFKGIAVNANLICESFSALKDVFEAIVLNKRLGHGLGGNATGPERPNYATPCK